MSKSKEYVSADDYIDCQRVKWERTMYIGWTGWLITEIVYITLSALTNFNMPTGTSLIPLACCLVAAISLNRRYYYDVSPLAIRDYKSFIRGGDTYEELLEEFSKVAVLSRTKEIRASYFILLLEEFKKLRKIYGKYYLDKAMYRICVKNGFYTDTVIAACMDIEAKEMEYKKKRWCGRI